LDWQTDADLINGKKLGAYTNPLSVDAKLGKRGYAAAYYSPDVAARPNLELLTETTVEQILLEQEDGDVIAKGVQVKTQGRNVADSRQEGSSPLRGQSQPSSAA
jgi:hypothetical protein